MSRASESLLVKLKTGHFKAEKWTPSRKDVPADPDGLWIHRSAAEALNASDAQDLRDGFRSELYNSRGVHWVDRTGKEERGLVSKYRGQAEAIENGGYPRLARTLREIAKEYEFEGQRMSSEEMMDE